MDQPIDMKLPLRRPLEYGKLTKEEFDAEIQKGVDGAESGKPYSADEVEALLKKKIP